MSSDSSDSSLPLADLDETVTEVAPAETPELSKRKLKKVSKKGAKAKRQKTEQTEPTTLTVPKIHVEDGLDKLEEDKPKMDKFRRCWTVALVLWFLAILAAFAYLLYCLWRTVNPVWVDIALNGTTSLGGEHLAYCGGTMSYDDLNYFTFGLFDSLVVSSDTPFVSFNDIVNVTSDGNMVAGEKTYVQYLLTDQLAIGNGVIAPKVDENIVLDLAGVTITVQKSSGGNTYNLRHLKVGNYLFLDGKLWFGETECGAGAEGPLPETCPVTQPAKLLSENFERRDGTFLGYFGNRIVKRVDNDVVLCKDTCARLFQTTSQKTVAFAKLVKTKVCFAITEYDNTTHTLHVYVFQDSRKEHDWEFTDVVGHSVMSNNTLVYSTGSRLIFVNLDTGTTLYQGPSNLRQFTARRLPMARAKISDASEILDENFELRSGTLYYRESPIVDVGPIATGAIDAFGTARVLSYSDGVLSLHTCKRGDCTSKDLLEVTPSGITRLFFYPPMIFMQLPSEFLIHTCDTPTCA